MSKDPKLKIAPDATLLQALYYAEHCEEVEVDKENNAVNADWLYVLRQCRLRLKKECEKVEKLEGMFREHIINTLPKSQTTGISGHIGNAKVVNEEKPTVTDWDAFLKHIKRTGEFELLQRRLGEGAIMERWAAKKEIPGIGHIFIPKVSCTKV